MSRTNAEQLAEAVKAIETNVNTIEELVGHAFAAADFNFVTDFRDARGATLSESGLIMTVLVKRMQDKLGMLGNVLYLREKESINPPLPWRELAKEGRRVEAITLLMKFAGSPAFSISDARDVIDAYIDYGF